MNRISPDEVLTTPAGELAALASESLFQLKNDAADLLAAAKAIVEHVRRAILSRMQSVARGTLDSVLLSAEAMRAWECVAVDAGTAMAADGIDPRKIPDEIAEQQPDGSLLIYVEVGGHRAELLVPPHHWQWSRRDRPA